MFSYGQRIGNSVIEIAQIEKVIAYVFGGNSGQCCIYQDGGFAQFVSEFFSPSNTVVQFGVFKTCSERIGPKKNRQFVEKDSFIGVVENLGFDFGGTHGFFRYHNRISFEQVSIGWDGFFDTAGMDEGNGGEDP